MDLQIFSLIIYIALVFIAGYCFYLQGLKVGKDLNAQILDTKNKEIVSLNKQISIYESCFRKILIMHKDNLFYYRQGKEGLYSLKNAWQVAKEALGVD